MTATDARPYTTDPAKVGGNAATSGNAGTSGSTTHVDEKQARQVAEAAREADWRKPSFGKQLFLGRLRMDLVEPWPTPDPEQQAEGEAFLAKLGVFTKEHIDGAQIERDARIQDVVFEGLAEHGAFGRGLGYPVHDGMVTGGQVTPDHRDPVTAGASACGRPAAAAVPGHVGPLRSDLRPRAWRRCCGYVC